MRTPREAASAVFRTLSHHVDAGQVAKVVDALPEEVRVLWRDAAWAAPAHSEASEGDKP